MATPPPRDAIDKLLARHLAEYETIVTEIRGMIAKAKKLTAAAAAARRDKLREDSEFLRSLAQDDDGDAINPELEEAISYLENEGAPDPSDHVDQIVAELRDVLDTYEGKVAELLEVQKNTPPGQFFWNRDDDDEEDEDEEDSDPSPRTEADIQKLIRSWRESHDDATVKTFELQTRIRYGIG